MIKSELVQIVAARNPHLYHRDVENIVNAVLDEITDALAAGNRVELRGFGAFSVKNRPARSGRNPRTGDKVFVPEKFVVTFKPGKEMEERVREMERRAAEQAGYGQSNGAPSAESPSPPSG